MIYVRPDVKLILVRGVRSMKDIEAEVLKATGRKTVRWLEWTIVGLADDDSKGITTGMPFTPPDASVGFEYSKKDR